jgi:hypothetical protein
LEPDELANCYLHSALVLLHGNSGLPYGASCRRSALKLQAKAILGAPLTNALQAAEPHIPYRLRWIGVHSDAMTNDHVVPLDAVISFVAANLDLFPLNDIQHFRSFISPRVVIARVPIHVDASITAAGLRNSMLNTSWHRTEKPTILWQRYVAVGIPPPSTNGAPWLQ